MTLGSSPRAEFRDPTRLRRRSVTIAGHRTSVSLENAFWDALKEIAAARGTSLARLVAEVDATRTGNLSSALRVFVLGQSQPQTQPGPQPQPRHGRA